MEVHPVDLREASGDPAGFITVDRTVFILFDFENPLARDYVFGEVTVNEFPSDRLVELVDFAFSGESPVFCVD